MKKIEENHRNSLYFKLLKASPRALKLKAGTENLFSLKTRKASFDELLEESGNYSRFAMGVNLAYRWALSRHREVYTAADGAKVATRVTEAHGDNFNTWLEGAGNIRTWSFQNLRTACQNSGVLNRIDLKKTSELQAFCDDCGKSFRKKPKTALPELAGLISEREEKVRGNSSRFVNPDIEVPDAIQNPPKDEVNPFFFSYRWTQGRSNIVDILEGLRR